MNRSSDSDSDEDLRMDDNGYAEISQQVEQHLGSIKNIDKEMADKFSQLKRMSEHYQARLGKDGELTEFEDLKGQLRSDGWENLGKEGVKKYLEDGDKGEIEQVINRKVDIPKFGRKLNQHIVTDKFIPRKSLIEKGEKLITELRTANAEGRQENRPESPSQPWLNKSPRESQDRIIAGSTRTVVRDSDRAILRTGISKARESRFKTRNNNGTSRNELSGEDLRSDLGNPETSIDPTKEESQEVSKEESQEVSNFEKEFTKDLFASKKYLALAEGRDLNQMQKTIDEQINRLATTLDHKTHDYEEFRLDSNKTS